MTDKSSQTKASEKLSEVTVKALDIVEAALDRTDSSKMQSHEIDRLDIALKFLATVYSTGGAEYPLPKPEVYYHVSGPLTE